MKNKILMSSVVALALMLNGCGDDEGESYLETQQMLDNGDFEGVISKLEPSLDANSTDSNENYLALASAYMGKAGYTLSDVVGAFIDEDEFGEDSDTDPIANLTKNATYDSTISLLRSEQYYKKVIGEDGCLSENADKLGSAGKDICLFLSLAAVSKVATTVNLLADDASAVFADNDDNNAGVPDHKYSASKCAIEFAFNNNLSDTSSTECKIKLSNQVNFTTIDKRYVPLEVTVNADATRTSYYYMMTEEDSLTHTRSTVMTSGYCSLDSFTPRVDSYNSSIYACPINEEIGEEDTTSMGVLVNALNDGLGSIGVVFDSDDEDNDVQSDIDEFKCEVLNGTYSEYSGGCSVSIENAVSEEQVIDYLNNQDGE